MLDPHLTHTPHTQVGEGGYSLLITWRGSDPSLHPVLFVSHYDVVPVTPGTEGDWTHPPFSGELADGWVAGHMRRRGLLLYLSVCAKWGQRDHRSL